MMRNGVLLGIMLATLVSGCIPRSATTPIRTTDAAPETPPDADAPRIDPQMDTVFDEAPVWEMRPVVANAVTVAGGSYTVVAGDTLRSIGNRTGAGSETLARANGLEAPFVIRPGQTLTVPAGRYHNVGEGETGIAIARAYGVAWQAIIAANGLEPPYALRIGQRLLLPGDSASSTLEARASAFKLDIDDILTGGEPAAVAEAPIAAPQPAPTRPLAPGVAVREPARFVGSFVWPADGRIANRFGPLGEGQVNQGIDIAVAQSAPISAAADGVVAFVGNDVANYGGLILIRHGEGWITAYGRATEASVTRGQSVKKGQAIGKAGTGTAPLLFFQMRKGGKPVDPVKQLPAR
jgi:murein DD-endopeptidase MepM/ murein hydrolase activator NlpD